MGAQARSGERALFGCRTAQLAFCLSAVVPAFANQTSIRCLGPEGRHRRLSVCSLPVLKQSEGSLGSFISVAQSVSGGTWQSARCVILVLFSLAWFLGRGASAIFCRHEISLSSIHGEQIRDHLARYCKRRSIGVPFLFLSFIEQRKIVILSGRQLRCLDQHKLDILVALFGNRRAKRVIPNPNPEKPFLRELGLRTSAPGAASSRFQNRLCSILALFV